MNEIRLDVPENFINEINYKIRKINERNIDSRQISTNDITKEALAVYKWVVDQLYDGYAIVSVNKNKELISQVETPNLPAKVPTK